MLSKNSAVVFTVFVVDILNYLPNLFRIHFNICNFMLISFLIEIFCLRILNFSFSDDVSYYRGALGISQNILTHCHFSFYFLESVGVGEVTDHNIFISYSCLSASFFFLCLDF